MKVRIYIPKDRLHEIQSAMDPIIEELVEKMKLFEDKDLKDSSHFIEPSESDFTEEEIIELLAMEKGWEFKKMYSYINSIEKFSPVAAMDILLKYIAVMIDKLYEGPIENSEEIWIISMINGKIKQIDKSLIKNYRNFPAFRTKEDALEARKILNKRFKRMFTGCGKE